MTNDFEGNFFDTNWLKTASKREIQIVVAALQLAISDLVDDTVDGHPTPVQKQKTLARKLRERIANLDIITVNGNTELAEEAASIGYVLQLIEMILNNPRQRSFLR